MDSSTQKRAESCSLTLGFPLAGTRGVHSELVPNAFFCWNSVLLNDSRHIVSIDYLQAPWSTVLSFSVSSAKPKSHWVDVSLKFLRLKGKGMNGKENPNCGRANTQVQRIFMIFSLPGDRNDCITKCRHYLGAFLQTQDVFSGLPMYHRMYNTDSAFRLLEIWSKLLFLHTTLVNINACTYTCLSARSLAISTVCICNFSCIRTISPPRYKIRSELKLGCNSPAISCLLQSFTVIKL